MSWQRLGRVFTPHGERDWMMSHASVPFAEPVDGSLHRIYFSPRDAHNRSYIGWLEIDLREPLHVSRLADAPVLGPGVPGTFNDCGSMMSWSVTHLGQRHIYFIGWNVRRPMPFHVSIGLARGDAAPGGAHVEPIAGPILDRTIVDPLFCSNPCVLKENERWRMWYLSGLGWEMVERRPSASYDVRYAESHDGVNWDRKGSVALDLCAPDEIAIARPSVLRTTAGYTMWFCARTRTRTYRLGGAHSRDGIHWQRDHSVAGLHPSESGWDSEMIAYPHVFEYAGRRYLLYCGNGFGRSGFGLAIWD